MASKTNVPNVVNERRLRPIYEWLDNGNNKKAIQEAEKVLKKQPGNQCSRVLKALALLRLGKENDCQVIMDKVRAEVPCEDSTLKAMSICYREMDQLDKISELYEVAVKADPSNEELLTHLFMSYVRLGDYKKQQQTAIALYKLKPKNPYYFWAVMSIVMQAMNSDEQLAKNVTLPLAERMMLKMVNEGKLEAEQEVQLYLMILEMQGKSEEMLKVLDSSHLSTVLQRSAVLYLKLEQFPAAVNAYKELIRGNIDNWAHYQNYLTAALHYQKPEECMEFLDKIIGLAERNVRAPYLAKLEVLKRIKSLNQPIDSLGDPIDLAYQYFEKFGEKGCVVGDLRLYMHLLSQTGKAELLQKISDYVGVAPDSFPTSIPHMQKHIHLEQLRRICGYHHPPLVDLDQQRQIVKRLCKLYEESSALCPIQDRLPTDFCPADAYILLAAHLLHQLWSQTNEARYIYEAIVLLERGLLSSSANFNVRILLVRIYLEAGLAGAADHAFALLGVKYIQLDSLGYLHAPLLAPLGHLSLAWTTLDHSAKYFIANYKDSADHLTFAYKYGSFEKIQEFMDLRDRLENSMHFAMTTVDKMLLELSGCDSASGLFSALSQMHIQPHEDSVRWSQLRDNRDLDVVCGWEPLFCEDPRMHLETRECMLKLLAARNLMLRILAAAAESDSASLLQKLAAELHRLDSEQIPPVLQKFGTDDNKLQPLAVVIPMDAVDRLREAHYSEQLRTVADLVEFLSQSDCPDNRCIEMLRASSCLQPLQISDQDTPVSYKQFLLRASTCGESLGIITALCSACVPRIHQAHTSNKKNKKKQTKAIQSPPGNELHQNWKEIAMLLEQRLHNLDAVLTELEKHELRMGLENEDEVSATVIKHAQTSLAQSCKSLKSRVQRTLILVESMRS